VRKVDGQRNRHAVKGGAGFECLGRSARVGTLYPVHINGLRHINTVSLAIDIDGNLNVRFSATSSRLASGVVGGAYLGKRKVEVAAGAIIGTKAHRAEEGVGRYVTDMER